MDPHSSNQSRSRGDVSSICSWSRAPAYRRPTLGWCWNLPQGAWACPQLSCAWKKRPLGHSLFCRCSGVDNGLWLRPCWLFLESSPKQKRRDAGKKMNMLSLQDKRVVRAAWERKALRDWNRVDRGQDGDAKQPPSPSISPLETLFDIKMSPPLSHLCVLPQFYVGAICLSFFNWLWLISLNTNFKGCLEELPYVFLKK